MPASPPPRLPRPTFSQLLWHWLMGVTLGVLCAGLLLHSGSPQLKDLTGSINGAFATLRFLLSVAFVFGVGATLTGVMFQANDSP